MTVGSTARPPSSASARPTLVRGTSHGSEGSDAGFATEHDLGEQQLDADERRARTMLLERRRRSMAAAAMVGRTLSKLTRGARGTMKRR
jgi:hypothetical protein